MPVRFLAKTKKQFFFLCHPFKVPSSGLLCSSGLLLPVAASFPLRDNTKVCPLVATRSKRRFVPPAGFLSLMAVFSRPRFWNPISYSNHVQDFIPVQGFLLVRSRFDLVDRSFSPPVVFLVTASPPGRVQLRGFFSTPEYVLQLWGLTKDRAVSFCGFLLSQANHRATDAN